MLSKKKYLGPKKLLLSWIETIPLCSTWQFSLDGKMNHKKQSDNKSCGIFMESIIRTTIFGGDPMENNDAGVERMELLFRLASSAVSVSQTRKMVDGKPN
jgi:hypothetical protein